MYLFIFILTFATNEFSAYIPRPSCWRWSWYFHYLLLHISDLCLQKILVTKDIYKISLKILFHILQHFFQSDTLTDVFMDLCVLLFNAAQEIFLWMSINLILELCLQKYTTLSRECISFASTPLLLYRYCLTL